MKELDLECAKCKIASSELQTMENSLQQFSCKATGALGIA